VSYIRMHDSTLEPDGQATGCNPVEVGSTPTGVFLSACRTHLAPESAHSDEMPCGVKVV
jgi:hypothetical protein